MNSEIRQIGDRNHGHEEFLELCAACLSHELTSEEQARLSEHLEGCEGCRQRYQEYRTILADITQVRADAYWPDSSSEPRHLSQADSSRILNQVLAKCEVDDRNEQGKQLEVDRTISEPKRVFIRRFLGWPKSTRAMVVAAALILCAGLFVAGYRFALVRTGHLSSPQTTNQQPEVNFRRQLGETTAQLESQTRIIEEAKTREAELVSRIAELQRREIALQENTAKIEESARREGIEKQALEATLAQNQESAAAMKGELDSLRRQVESVRQQKNTDTIRAADLESQLQQLKAHSDNKDHEAAQLREWLDSDRDIRDLMGARDLVITEVHDIIRNGNTQKPFARVFYTKGKSLVFYAYDLDQQPGVKNATFQAWGVRGADEKHATNLGILYSDNDAKKRWILKFDDPETLKQIDAVFVTVEPNGGSRAPSGKQLLFAYLGMRSNHP